MSERGCLHFNESQWNLYSIYGRIIRWSIVLLLEVENELCSRCIIFYHWSNRSNIQMLTRAVPHTQDVYVLMCEHMCVPVLWGAEFSFWHHGLWVCRCPASGVEVPITHQRLWWVVYFESLRKIPPPKFQLQGPPKSTIFLMKKKQRESDQGATLWTDESFNVYSTVL